VPQMRLARDRSQKISQDGGAIFWLLPPEEWADQWLQFQGLSKPLGRQVGNAIRHQHARTHSGSCTPDPSLRL
jgi:hypothetical protein